MEKPKTYCDYAATLDPANPHRQYHDTEYGFPIKSDNELFGRLILEINQAGLSWTTILQKQANFRAAYAGYEIERVAQFTETDISRLLNDPGIIRNKLKVNAAIHNARQIQQLQQQHGSFQNWLDQHHPKTREAWVTLFKQTFKFTGGEITNEFLVSTGYLAGAHAPGCPVYEAVLKQGPRCMD